jgi:hypothetical protein
MATGFRVWTYVTVECATVLKIGVGYGKDGGSGSPDDERQEKDDSERNEQVLADPGIGRGEE